MTDENELEEIRKIKKEQEINLKKTQDKMKNGKNYDNFLLLNYQDEIKQE